MISPESLKTLLMNNQVIPIKFAGNRLLLDGDAVLVWPQQDLLIFSDLHLEKGSFLSQFANPLPRFDSKDTLKRMQRMIERYDCKHIVCLGDSLHDGNAISRMQHDDLALLNSLVASVKKWTWVLGNHDPEIPQAISGERAPYLQIHNLLLTHEPEEIASKPEPKSKLKYRPVAVCNARSTVFVEAKGFHLPDAQIIGHFHPKTTYKLVNRKVTGKSFVCAENILLMPAFGRYTGGLDTSDRAYASLFDMKIALTYLTYHHKIYLL